MTSCRRDTRVYDIMLPSMLARRLVSLNKNKFCEHTSFASRLARRLATGGLDFKNYFACDKFISVLASRIVCVLASRTNEPVA
uniref:Orf-45 protein n=1 Tax=Lymantria dispar multicapsid nuclear polyhedrosis virus TaxID=10449 RepID=A0A140IKV6_NPVLD|nr:hypothetical protein [Lymantria dispar multiple nucleopolyhedrovirus]AMO65541.1 Orf-45 protein [Lymantria dispar multiple nucleopolyhedrovirus]